MIHRFRSQSVILELLTKMWHFIGRLFELGTSFKGIFFICLRLVVKTLVFFCFQNVFVE